MTTPTSTPTGIAYSQARALLDAVANAAPTEVERKPLSRALGLVLATDVIAGVDLPGFDNSAMDGYAVRSSDLRAGAEIELQLIGEQFAGPAVGLQVEPGQCARITTGAPMPTGADAIVIKEKALPRDGRVGLTGPLKPGTHVRHRGEDVRAGDTVLAAGRVLTPAALSLAAAVGTHEVNVHRRPTVAVFTTGDELRPPGMALEPGQIYDSNRVLLQTLLSSDGFEPVAWPVLADDPAAIVAALRDAAFSFDVVITCGGVSAGEKDFLPALLAEHGSTYFWKVRMRPGMPVLAGRLGAAHLLCLPGNPVSVFATYLALARPFLDGLQARRQPRQRWFAELGAQVTKSHDRLEFLRGSLSCDPSGQLRVEPNPADGSHRLRAVAESNALIILPEGAGAWQAGSVLEVLPLPPT